MTLSALPPKKRKYAQFRAKGHSKAVSARKAGYAESVALNAGNSVETPDVKAVMRSLMQRAAPPSRIVERISEGLDAKKTEFFSKDGIVTDQRDTVAWAERRAYLELAAEYAGYVSTEQEQTSSVHVLALLQAEPVGGQDQQATPASAQQPAIDVPSDATPGDPTPNAS